MPAESQTTTDHDDIRSWADARAGRPARVHGTGGHDHPGVIRIMFADVPRVEDENLEEISWGDWFDAFDENGLALVYQEETADGEQSRFNKLVAREHATQA